jgi:hypothetical protein
MMTEQSPFSGISARFPLIESPDTTVDDTSDTPTAAAFAENVDFSWPQEVTETMNETSSSSPLQGILPQKDDIVKAFHYVKHDRRYGGVCLLLLYLFIMALCARATVSTYRPICAAQPNEALAVSVAWRLSHSRRPPNTCSLDPRIDALLQAGTK